MKASEIVKVWRSMGWGRREAVGREEEEEKRKRKINSRREKLCRKKVITVCHPGTQYHVQL